LVGGPGHQRRVAQQAEPVAVGDDTPEVLGAVEVLLHQGVGAEAGSAGGGTVVQVGAAAGDVERRRVFVGAGAVGDGVSAAADHGGARDERDLIVAEGAEEGKDPLLAGDGGGGVVLREAAEGPLEGLPVGAGVGPGSGNLVGEAGTPWQAEVGRLLADGLTSGDLLKDVGGDQSTFGADAGERHSSISNSPAFCVVLLSCVALSTDQAVTISIPYRG